MPSAVGEYSLTATAVDNTGLIKESDTLPDNCNRGEWNMSPTMNFYNIISTNDSNRYVTGSQLSFVKCMGMVHAFL